jgi:serine/threonine protein kinase
MIGRTLGHYRIVGKIGAGGMGEVYRAHDDQLDRDVALKVLPPGLLADEAARKRFRKEALALARLNHPNIETVYEFSTEDGVDFLALELIQGSPLSEMLRRGTLPSTDTIPIAIQLARALAAAHEQHVVHRDLKPGNLMITSDGRLKVLDFGLARLLRPARDLEMTVSVSERRGRFRAPFRTCRRSSCGESPRTRGATFSPPVSCSTRWQRAGGPFPRIMPQRSWAQYSTRRPRRRAL